MVLSLNEALQDPDVQKELQEHPSSFRFRDEVEVMATTLPWWPNLRYVDEGDSIKIEGAMANFFQILATSMNFTYQVTPPSDGFFGSRRKNGSWNGMVGLVSTGKADFGLGPLAVTEPRWRVVSYAQPVLHDNLVILTSKGSLEIDPWAFLLPLTPTLWGMLMATLVVVWAATLLVGRLGQAWRQWPHSVFLQLYGVLMQQGEGAGLAALVQGSAGWWVEITSRTLAHTFLAAGVTMPLCGQRLRLVVGGWVVASALVVWSYSGLLVSVMTVRHVPLPIQSVQDMVDASHVKVIIDGNSAYTDLMAQAKSGVMHDLNGLRKQGRMLYKGTKMMEYLRFLRLGDYASIQSSLSATNIKAMDFQQ
ncbi:hypothetical protein O3P69_002402 [Scylla paramamosain]|uniref:Ionotropic glutamate receptor L-glutamate and glycine-binding domain-containing protein n=1 Tax=Scylla paramamosain TaxID=85552 RepID=A0AAW0V7U3_SCYPA